MQMFRKPVKFAQQGDRVGICVTGLDPTAIERGVLAAPGSVPLLSSAIIMAKKVRYFKQACRSKQKFHISVGHTTVVASVMFFGAAELHIYLQQQQANKSANLKDTDSKEWQYGEKCDFPKIDFSWDQDFEYQDDICGAPDEVNNKINSSASLKKQRDAIALSSKADIADDFSAIEASDSDSGVHTLRHGEEAVQFALLVFQHPILVPLHTLAIGSRLETDAKESAVNATHCRIAFYGPVLCPAAPAEAFLPSAAVTKDKPRIFIWKSKEAEILRLVDVSKDTGLCKEAIGWKLFSKEAGIAKYLNLRLETANGEVVGYIHSSFGATGKFKIKFPLGVSGIKPGSRLFLRYKRFIYDKTKAICQTNMGFTPLAERDAAPISIFVEPSASITADDLDEGDEEDGNSLTPRFVAGFAIDSDGEDDVQDIAGITHGATQTVTVTATAESSLPVASTLLATPAAEVVQSEEAVKGVPSVELSIPPAGNCRTGTIDSIKPNSNNAGCVCVVSGIFHMEENIRDHVGAIAVSSGGMRGSLVGPYAKMGKCKIEFLSADKVSVGDTIDIVF